MYGKRPRVKQPMMESPSTDSDDPDYIPSFSDLGKSYRINSTPKPSSIKKQTYTKEEQTYLKTLSNEEQKKMEIMETSLMKHQQTMVPLRFKILQSNLDDRVKYILMTKLQHFQEMNEEHGEYYKLKQWFHAFFLLPLNQYVSLPISLQSSNEDIQRFIHHVQNTLNEKIYGHTHCKDQFLKIVAQWISNPFSMGHAIGIQGAPGTGKTSFVKEGIANALKMPFGFITLGGASDGSFLEGHSMVYEGSSYGKIVDILVKTKCMNPIIFFDELDKVSCTKKGDEIIGVLTHLTDQSQNKSFTDKYFHGIDLDLSRALFIFSYNDETKLNPILKNRMITLSVNGYTDDEKITIMKDYLLPTILKTYGFQPNEIVFSQTTLKSILNKTPKEEGIRLFKRAIETMVSELNLKRYTGTIPLPYEFV